MGRCGLRKDGILRVQVDVLNGPSGTHLQVESATGGHRRVPSIPDQLVRSITVYTGALDVVDDDPPMSDAALTHLVESKSNIEEARGEIPLEQIRSVGNTSVLALRYRTSVESRWH